MCVCVCVCVCVCWEGGGRYKNLNKVFAPRVIPMAKGAIIMLRRSYSRTVRPHQWHVTRGGHTIEKEFQGGG